MTDPERLEDRLGKALADLKPPPALVDRVMRALASSDPVKAASLLERARERLASLLLDSRTRPALAGFRGPMAGFHLLFAKDDHEVFMEVLAPGTVKDAFEVQAQLRRAGRGAPSASVLAVSAPGGAPVAEVLTDQDGMFALSLPAGRYDLAVGLDPPFLVEGIILE